MNLIVRTSVPNSVLLVMGNDAGVIPESMNGDLVSATSSCIAVGTAAECDESVEVVLTDRPLDDDVAMWCVSESRLETPNGEVAVCSVLGEQFLVIQVQEKMTLVQIWVNHAKEPNRIVILVREAGSL